ncbi:MAG: hypothetical protein AAF567_12660 [Actinomycetota bacterium]
MGEVGATRSATGPTPTSDPRVRVLGVLLLLAPFNLVGRRSGGWLLLPLVAIALAVALGLIVSVVAVADERELLVRRATGRMRLLCSLAVLTLAGVWASVLVSADRLTSAGAGARLSVVFTVLVATAVVVRSQDDGWFLLRRAAIGTLMALVISFAVLLNDGELPGTTRFFGRVTQLGPYDRLTRPWSHANVAAMVLGVTAVGIAALRTGWSRSLAAATFVIAAIATYSRGGVAALAVGALVYVVLSRERTAARLLALLTVLGVGLALVLPGWSGRTTGATQAQWFQVGIDAPSAVALDGEPAIVGLTIANESNVLWANGGVDAVVLSGRWLHPGTDEVAAEQRWPLPGNIRPGEERAVTVDVQPVGADGNYVLLWDLLMDRRAYFRQFLGSEPVVSDLRVVDSTFDERGPQGRLVPLREFPGRSELYPRAIDTWLDDPVFGIGPGRFSVTGEPNRTAAHAHNLVLEPLATWGLVGTLPLLALLAASAWFAVLAAWRDRHPLAILVMTALVIAATHGVVEWPFVHVGVAIPIGVILGLVASPAIIVPRSQSD